MNRRLQSNTVGRLVESCRARTLLATPSAAPRTIRARIAMPWGAARALLKTDSSRRSASLTSRAEAGANGIPQTVCAFLRLRAKQFLRHYTSEAAPQTDEHVHYSASHLAESDCPKRKGR